MRFSEHKAQYYNELNKKLVDNPDSSILWDEFWIRKKKDYPKFFIFDESRYMEHINACIDTTIEFVPTWINNEIKTILLAGNGVSQHPKLLQYSGFDVTAIDISPYATSFASDYVFNNYEYSTYYTILVGSDKNKKVTLTFPKRSGGALEFITGDFISDDILIDKRFDVIMCFKTLQYYSGTLLAKACERLVSLLSQNGFLVIGVTNHPHIVKEILELLKDKDIQITNKYLEEPLLKGKRCLLFFEE